MKGFDAKAVSALYKPPKTVYLSAVH